MRNLALAVPFFMAAFGSTLIVGPLGDRIGRDLSRAAMTEATEAPAVTVPWSSDPPPDVALDASADAGAKPRSRDAGKSRTLGDAGADASARVSFLTAPSAGTIDIPQEKVAGALVKKDVSATNAVDEDGAPLGARLAGVGKYGVGLKDGDVVVVVAGRRTPNVAAMVTAAMGASGGGAGVIRGRVLRRDAVWDVVLHVPKD